MKHYLTAIACGAIALPATLQAQRTQFTAKPLGVPRIRRFALGGQLEHVGAAVLRVPSAAQRLRRQPSDPVDDELHRDR